MTVDDIRRVARTVFVDDAMTVATLMPQPIDPAAQRESAPPRGLRH